MRAAALASLQDALRDDGTRTPQAHVEREAMVQSSLNRLARLELGTEALCFGRIDRETGETFHIGRLAVSDEDHEPLVVDWRAPAAEPFYRATGRHPLGLRRRRHFLTEGRTLLDLEDELFGGEGDGGEGGLGLPGSAALLAALEQSRSGRMRDIVATVQREQDEVIRSPLPGVLVVQGGPGTGKTAVALHRAAYLLYSHRFPLERQGVLVVGPNRLFLRYIEFVLPSLGESGVTMTTVAGVAGLGEARAREPGDVSRLKGDERMARVLGRAVRDRQRPLRRGVTVGFGAHTLHITPHMTEAAVAAGRRRRGPHNARRADVERQLFRELHEQWERAARRLERTGLAPAPTEPDADLRDELQELGVDLTPVAREEPSAADLRQELRRDPEVRAVLERIWPRLTPQMLLHDLFGARPLLGLAGRGVLGGHEQDLLLRGRSASVDDVAWTAADLPLLDEAAALLGPLRPGATDAGPRTYGHIVVDEAQDLTPMQLRMLTRRSLSGSMTLVGDVAQATGQWAPQGWDDVLRHLPARSAATRTELTVNYRTPAEIMAVAGLVLAEALPDAPLPESIRPGGVVTFQPASPDDAVSTVVATAERELAAVDGGSLVVVAPPSWLDDIADALDAAGLASRRESALDAPVTLVPVELVKGLEFDAVVVVEPARLVAEAGGRQSGLRALYVALTRATRRLAVVHAEPLPSMLRRYGS